MPCGSSQISTPKHICRHLRNFGGTKPSSRRCGGAFCWPAARRRRQANDRATAYRSCVGSAVKLSDRPNSRVEERRGSLGQASAISRLRIPCWRRLADFKVAVCAGDDEAALPEGFHGVLVNFYPWKLERNAPSEEERQAAAETLWEEFRGPLEHHLGVLVGKVRGRVMIVERGYVIKIKRRSRPWARSFSILRPPA